MRTVFLIGAILFLNAAAFASEIREFDLKTIERLGAELARESKRPDRGATNPVRKRAKQTAIAALKGKLFNIHYDYVVLDDPDGSGFLVYALGTTTIQTTLFWQVTFASRSLLMEEKLSASMHFPEVSPFKGKAKVCCPAPTK